MRIGCVVVAMELLDSDSYKQPRRTARVTIPQPRLPR